MATPSHLRTAMLVSAMVFAGSISSLPAQAGGDTLPRLDASYPNRQPPYPDAAQINGEQGTTLVDVLVRPSGKPVRAKVSQSSGYADLDTAAVQGVLNWRFVPAMRDGDTVSDWTTVKVVFQLPRYVPAASSQQTDKP